jgi:hypothetical protein
VLLAAGAAAFGIDLENPPTPGVVGMPYKYVFIAKKGAPPYAFWLDSGDLPPGLKIDPDGTMHGTPEVPGTWNFTVGGSQYDGSETQWGTSVTIRDRLNITTASLKNGIVGAPYTAAVGVTGHGGKGMGWTISSGALPTGLTLAFDGTPTDGLLSGTPTTPGVYTFALKVDDTDGFMPSRAITKQFTVTVATQLSATAAGSIPSGIEGKQYNATPVTATGGLAPFTWSVVDTAAFPAGLTLDPVTGAISGRPTSYGTFAFALRVGDASGQGALAQVVLTIVRALDLRTTKLRAASAGDAYSATLRTVGGQAPRTFSVAGGKLPSGLKLNAKTGVISGKPKKAGTSRFRITVRDSLGQRSSAPLSLTVHA